MKRVDTIARVRRAYYVQKWVQRFLVSIKINNLRRGGRA